MKKAATILFLSVLVLAGSAYTVQSFLNWKINSEKAMVKFTLKAHGQDVVGNFKGAKGDVKFDPNDLSHSAINCSVDVSTINTGIEGRDKHLQATEYFDAAAYPTLTFTSTKIEKSPEGYAVTGKLTAKGVSKDVTALFVFAESTEAGGSFTGGFLVKRSDFKIGKEGNEPGDEVTINFDIPVTKE
jgi:polyisoprenoid-binding protein YceI